MFFDEWARWTGFWFVDALSGGRKRKYYEASKDAWKNGSDVKATEEKIRRVIRHAAATTGFYGKYAPDTPLTELPVVNKDVFRADYDAFISDMYKDAKDNREMWTSGSTGTPFCMVQDRNKIDHDVADGVFTSALGGYYIGMKQAFVRVWLKKKKESRLSLFAQNMIKLDCSVLDEANLASMVELIKKKKVKAIIGYSAALAELSRYIENHGIDTSDCCVRAITPISEAMPTEARKSLERQFGCECRCWYSNEENGIMGLQDRDGDGYWINTESYYYEILKPDSDEPCEDGEVGRIVITDLYNYAFPLLRYDTGDMAAAERTYKDGRYKLHLTELYGRRADIIYDVNGNPVTPISTNMWNLKGVKQFRFIQEDETKYRICLNGDPDEMDIDDVLGRLYPYLGNTADITAEIVDEIPVLNSGKRKFLEQRCPKYLKKK